MVEISLVLDASTESFEAGRDEFKAKLAEKFGVEAADISLVVSPASILVAATQVLKRWLRPRPRPRLRLRLGLGLGLRLGLGLGLRLRQRPRLRLRAGGG